MADLPLTELVLATGAVGIAASGIVETLKFTPLGLLGFNRLRAALGTELMDAEKLAYGKATDAVLAGYYRQDRVGGALARALRQGVRVGLRADNAHALASVIGVGDGGSLERAVSVLATATTADPAPPSTATEEDRGVIARFELAVDARIEAAIAVADATYVGQIRLAAAFVALVLALAGAYSLGEFPNRWVAALIVGVAAVPIAPIAKDVASGIQAARKALSGGR